MGYAMVQFVPGHIVLKGLPVAVEFTSCDFQHLGHIKEYSAFTYLIKN